MTKPSVLIVDDEPDILELLDITLSRMNLETLCASRLSEAYDILAQHSPALCLTDMRLPDWQWPRASAAYPGYSSRNSRRHDYCSR